MTKNRTLHVGLGVCLLAMVVCAALAQPPVQEKGARRGGRGGAAGETRVSSVPDAEFLGFPLAAEDQKYGSIDGAHIKEYVKGMTAISRKYRDAGHQYWGRITGMDSDRWSAEYMADKLREVGCTNVKIQEVPLPPQWSPQSWSVALGSGSESVSLNSAWPSSQTQATPAEGLNLEVVYLGWGSEPDFIGKDLKDKAAFLYSMPTSGSRSHTASSNGAIRRAEERGAAAIFIVIEMPGNIRHALYPQGAAVTTFSLSSADGATVRRLIAASPEKPVRVNVKLDAPLVPRLVTHNVWGEVPGTSDEDIMIIAHRDGFFDAGSDNASGVATAIGVAEYFSRQPKESRKRTIRIVGTPGHHGTGGSLGVKWLADNKDSVFPKTAFLINSEHTAQALVNLAAGGMSTVNVQGIFNWGTSGSAAVTALCVKAYDSFGIPRSARNSGGPGAEGSRLAPFCAASTGIIHAAPFFHSDAETDDTIPAAGLAASTRAYAKIIDGVNKLTMEQLKGPAQQARVE